MDQAQEATYFTILGSDPEKKKRGRSIVISLILPRLGEYDFKWTIAPTIGKEYGHYGFRIHPRAQPVNVQVYGERELIETLARTRKAAKCELELVVKKTAQGREYILVNLYLTKPWLHETHEFAIDGTSLDPEQRPWFVYATKDMLGVGISVKPLSN